MLSWSQWRRSAVPEGWDRLVYLDLLCGPGRDIDTDTDEEFLGSPLIALSIEPQFDHLYLADKDSKNVKALEKESPPRISRGSLSVKAIATKSSTMS